MVPPIRQPMANIRRKGGLDKDTERPRTRPEQLTAIDTDWSCPWPHRTAPAWMQ